MRSAGLPLVVAAFLAAAQSGASARDGVRFDRPVYTTDTTVLCPNQGDIAALSRASEANDRAAVERIASRSCRLPGLDLRLSVVAMPGLYDPDVEVRIASALNLDPSLPRGKLWTLKTMLSNQPSSAATNAPPPAPR
jgi:hypothetical protein